MTCYYRRFLPMMVWLMILFTGVTKGGDAYVQATGIGPSYLHPTKAKVEKLDPFWGGEISGWWTHFKMSGGLHIGKIEKSFEPYGNVSANDILVNVAGHYLLGEFLEGELRGVYGSIGLGYYLEMAQFEGNIAGQSFKEKLKGNSLTFEVGGGFMFGTGAVEAKYVVFAASENVTSAVAASLILYFTGRGKNSRDSIGSVTE